MKRMLFLYNPTAGKGRARDHLATVVEAFTRSGWLVTAYPTQHKGDAAALAAELGDGQFERVVCCGGDGTLHEVVEGLMAVEDRPVVGYIPAGSTNDFAQNLSLPRSYEKMALTAAAGVPKPCDVGRFNERCFIYVAAFGAFTDVAYDTPQEFKNMFGHLAYLLEGLARLPNLKTYALTVEHDGGVVEDEFLFGMVSNTISVGGFKGMAGSGVELDDGKFEVVLIKRPSTPGDLQSILRAFLQQTPDEQGRLVGLRTSRLTITCGEELPWTLDGEFGGAPRVARIENCQGAITIVHGE